MRFKGLVPTLSALSFLFLLGSGLLTFFVILSGANTSGTLGKFYWFEANTTGINSAPATTRWFNYKWCGYENGKYVNCSNSMAAEPFSPRDNFGSSPNLPSSFQNNRDTYYYLSRIGWAMLLLGLLFLVLAIVPAGLAIFMRGKILVASVIPAWIALFFITLSACLYTGCYVKGRNAFHDSDRSASMNTKMFAFLWTTVFLLLGSSIWSLVNCIVYRKKVKPIKEVQQPYEATSSYDDSYNVDKQTYESGPNSENKKKKWWNIHFKKTSPAQS